jgi:hypothetical protein
MKENRRPAAGLQRAFFVMGSDWLQEGDPELAHHLPASPPP